MRLTLVISSLSCGGAERVISTMANYWVNKGWEITLVTFEDGTVLPFYELDCRINYKPLGIAKNYPNLIAGICNHFKRLRKLRSTIADSKPDAVISFMVKVNIITLIVTRNLNRPVVISERVDPARYSIGKIWDKLRRWTYPMATGLVVQSKRALSYFAPQMQKRTYIIPNPVLLPRGKIASSEPVLGKRSLIAMGRLEWQKGFDLLLQAFAKLKTIYPEWALIILGEGTWRSELERLRDQLGLTHCVQFPGRVKNPYTYLKQAEIFILSSRFEGFPNALCEAMACGLPVIATDCPSVAREIIRHGVDGMLVPNEDVDALTTTMTHLISDPGERQRLGIRASEITERFSLETVMGMWKTLLENVVEEKL